MFYWLIMKMLKQLYIKAQQFVEIRIEPKNILEKYEWNWPQKHLAQNWPFNLDVTKIQISFCDIYSK